MNQFGLIIQETTAGSNQQFISAHLDINSPEIKETITDERTLASQLANLSDVYSVQVTKNYKVYSLIVTNLTDFLGRSGYYAIRLYGPKGVNLTNFESILANIKEKYNNYTNSNTLNNQNYDDILSNISIVENDRRNIVSLKSAMNFFYYFDDANSNLSTVFNTKGVHLAHKIYAFNKNKAVNESIALTSGLKSFSQLNASQKEINVVNNYGLLNELKINDQLIDFNPNFTEFNVLCQNTDMVVYNAKDDRTYKTITNNFISIEKKFVPRPQLQPQHTYQGTHHRKKKNNTNAMYLIVGLIVLVLGGGIFYKFTQDGPQDPPTPSGGNPPKTEDGATVVTDIKVIEFEKTPYKKSETEFEYTTSYQKLINFKFIYTNNEWTYSKGSNGPIVFFKETTKKFGLSEVEVKSLIKELEEISGNEILEKAAEKKAAEKKGEEKKGEEKKGEEKKAAKDKAAKDKAAKKNAVAGEELEE